MKKLIQNLIFLCIVIIMGLNVLFTGMKSKKVINNDEGFLSNPEIKHIMVKDEQLLITANHSPVIKCDSKIQLPNIVDQKIGGNNIFFMETSPKETITPRVGCALESASRYSGLQVIMVRASPTLDLTHNTTCQMYSRCSVLI